MRRWSTGLRARMTWAASVTAVALAISVPAGSAAATDSPPDADSPAARSATAASADTTTTPETSTSESTTTSTATPDANPTPSTRPTTSASATPRPTATPSSTAEPTAEPEPRPDPTEAPEEPQQSRDDETEAQAAPEPESESESDDDTAEATEDEPGPSLTTLYTVTSVWQGVSVRTAFSDLGAGSGVSTSQADAVAWLALQGAGFGRGLAEDHPTFDPATFATRADLAAFLYRAAGLPLQAWPEHSPYTDVDTEDTAYTEIAWLAARDVELDADESTFEPTRETTRGEVALALHRLAGERRIVFVPGLTFEPVEAPSEHETSTQWLESLGVAAPGSDEEAAAEPLTRAELAELLYTVVADGLALTDGTSIAARLGYSGDGVPSLTGQRNGNLSASALCAVPWDSAHALSCHAAADLESLNAAFADRFETDLPITDSYRSLSGQRVAKLTKGNLAATPGTSQHGWGAAIDLNGGALPGGYRGAAYAWLVDHAPEHGWELPAWARPGGAKPEPWHFEHRG